jgi:hypothetical protein
MGEKVNAYRILVGIPAGKRSHGTLWRDGKIVLKQILK